MSLTIMFIKLVKMLRNTIKIMKNMKEFIETLASKEPTPGGGGAAAMVGTGAAALCSMVANLTSGKKKYEMYQEDMDRILHARKQK